MTQFIERGAGLDNAKVLIEFCCDEIDAGGARNVTGTNAYFEAPRAGVYAFNCSLPFFATSIGWTEVVHPNPAQNVNTATPTAVEWSASLNDPEWEYNFSADRTLVTPAYIGGYAFVTLDLALAGGPPGDTVAVWISYDPPLIDAAGLPVCAGARALATFDGNGDASAHLSTFVAPGPDTGLRVFAMNAAGSPSGPGYPKEDDPDSPFYVESLFSHWRLERARAPFIFGSVEAFDRDDVSLRVAATAPAEGRTGCMAMSGFVDLPEGGRLKAFVAPTDPPVDLYIDDPAFLDVFWIAPSADTRTC